MRTLYHQTSPDRASSILSSQSFRRGSSGLSGGGIYFAVCEADTHHKAHHKGAILCATVRLGTIKKIGANGDNSVTFHSLDSEGYDSVEIPRPGGTEFVVYNSDQVTNIRRV